MKAYRIAVTALLCTFAFTAVANAAQTGTWSIEPGSSSQYVHFDVHYDDADGHDHNSSSEDVPIAALGLSQAQLESSGSHVTFSLVREAGTFACEGWIANVKGGGTYTFSASSEYLTKMHALGYDVLPRKQIAAAMVDLTSAYVEAIGRAGYTHLDFDKLIAFRALGVDEAYVRGMRSTFPNTDLSADDLIASRALKVTPEYVTQMRAAGFTIDTARNAISLRALRVDLAYVQSLAAVGYTHLTAGQLIQMRAMRIDADYIKRVEAHGIKNPTVDELVRLKAMNIVSSP